MAEMNDLAGAAKKMSDFLQTLTAVGKLRLRYRITAGAGAVDPDGLERRDIYIELSGPDSNLVTDRNGELLRGLEHIASQILQLEPQDHDRISFDADGFKSARAQEMRSKAEVGIVHVRQSGQPYSFLPMSSRERRMLHLALGVHKDLRTESSGEGARRLVILYPVDWKNSARAQAAAKSFRVRQG